MAGEGHRARRAVDRDGAVPGVSVRGRRDEAVTERLLREALEERRRAPGVMVAANRRATGRRSGRSCPASGTGGTKGPTTGWRTPTDPRAHGQRTTEVSRRPCAEMPDGDRARRRKWVRRVFRADGAGVPRQVHPRRAGAGRGRSRGAAHAAGAARRRRPGGHGHRPLRGRRSRRAPGHAGHVPVEDATRTRCSKSAAAGSLHRGRGAGSGPAPGETDGPNDGPTGGAGPAVRPHAAAAPASECGETSDAPRDGRASLCARITRESRGERRTEKRADSGDTRRGEPPGPRDGNSPVARNLNDTGCCAARREPQTAPPAWSGRCPPAR